MGKVGIDLLRSIPFITLARDLVIKRVINKKE